MSLLYSDLAALDEDDGWAALEQLTPAEQATYLELCQQVVDEQWMLTPKQELAELLWRHTDWLLYGGSAGGGKSEFACWHANRLSQQIPGHVTLMLRQSIPELRRSLILRMLARNKQHNLGARYRKVDGSAGFHYALSGSLIECGYLATEEHVAQYLSAEYDCILIDEATQMGPNQIVLVSSRLRTTKTKAALGARPHLGLFTNPGDVAHEWMHRLIVSPTEYGHRVIVYDTRNGIENAVLARSYEAPVPVLGATDEQIVDELIPWAQTLEVEVDPINETAIAMVPSQATDNPHIDRSYMKWLNSLPEKKRRQWRDGDWETFEGQYFEEWDRAIHVMPAFDIPREWPRARGADYGTHAPWCCLWGAWDNDGTCYVYREAYGTGLTPERQARQAAEMSMVTDITSGVTRKEVYERTVADPSAWRDDRGAGRTVAQQWRDNGFHATKAINDRIAGWANVRQYLWDYNRESPGPRLYVFENCHNLARTLPLMQHDKLKPEDMNSKLEDHAVDALRYLLATRPIGARQRVVKVGQSVDGRFQQMMRRMDKRRSKWQS